MRDSFNRRLFCKENKNLDGSPDMRINKNREELNDWILMNSK